MALFTPNKRDIVKAATQEAKKQLFDEARELTHRSTEKAHEANNLKAKERQRHDKKTCTKLQKLADALNKVATTHGFPDLFSVSTTSRVHSGIEVPVSYLNLKGGQVVGSPYPEVSPKVQKLLDEAKELSALASEKRDVATRLQEQEVISGRINEALNGEAAEALRVLVRNIKETAIKVL